MAPWIRNKCLRLSFFICKLRIVPLTSLSSCEVQRNHSTVPSIQLMFVKIFSSIATMILYVNFCRMLPSDFSAASFASCQSILHARVKTSFSKATLAITLSFLTFFSGILSPKALTSPLAELLPLSSPNSITEPY